jgi:hypothetical protein
VSEDASSRCAEGPGFEPGAIESPSLFGPCANGRPDTTAFEVKFLLAEDLARRVEALVRDRLEPDEHGDPGLGGAYATTSLYTDTPDFEVFRRSGEYGRTKFRVRRYGLGETAFLERKDKDGERVHKSRVHVALAGLASVGAPGEDREHALWFRQEVVRRRLAPVCRVSYERAAFVGLADSGAVRVTFDRKVRGEATARWELVPAGPADELFPGQVICEFKFRAVMPHMLQAVVRTLGLQPTACSKYRRFVEASGVAGEFGAKPRGGAADA